MTRAKDKGVVGTCETCGKKQFADYKSARKFALKITAQNARTRKARGSNFARNCEGNDCADLVQGKRLRVIYVCRFCGLWHFSSERQWDRKMGNKEIFARNLNALMKERKIGLEELADAVGCDCSRVCNWKSARAFPSKRLAFALRELFGSDAERLFKGTRNARPALP